MDNKSIQDHVDSDTVLFKETEQEQQAIEDEIGNLLENGGPFEGIPDLISEALEGESYNDIPFEDVTEERFIENESNNNATSNNHSSKMESRRSNDTYSKIDFSVEGIQIRDEKVVEIWDSVRNEGIENGWSEEQIQEKISERIDDVKNELRGIRSDIEHYSGLIDSLNESGNPVHLRSMTSFQLLRFETDAACREYIKAGGAVGKDCFLRSAASSSQLGMSMIDVFRSNAIEDAILSKAADINIGFDEIYGGTHSGVTTIGKIASPFMAIGKALGFAPGSILNHIFSGIDKAVFGDDVSQDDMNDINQKTSELESPSEDDVTETWDTDVDSYMMYEETFYGDFDQTEDNDTESPEPDTSDQDRQIQTVYDDDPNQTATVASENADSDVSQESVSAGQPAVEVAAESQQELQITNNQDSEPEADSDTAEPVITEGKDNPVKNDLSSESQAANGTESQTDTDESEKSLIIPESEEPEEQPIIGEEADQTEEPTDISENDEAERNPDVIEGTDSDEEEKRDSITAEVSRDDEYSGADIDDSEDLDKDDSPVIESDRINIPDQQSNQADSQPTDDILDDFTTQNDVLEGNTELAVRNLDTEKTETIGDTSDTAVRITDIVDNAVQMIENGITENEVLTDASMEIADFYESEILAGDVSMENIIDTIADSVHEIASVFEIPTEAAEVLLQGITDEDAVDAIRQQIEEVNADMTIDATGSFGSLEYDSTGNVVDKADISDSGEQFESSGIDLDSTINNLETHMESAVETPELQDIIANEQKACQLDVDTGTESMIDSGIEGRQNMTDAVAGSGDSIEDVIMSLL